MFGKNTRKHKLASLQKTYLLSLLIVLVDTVDRPLNFYRKTLVSKQPNKHREQLRHLYNNS